MVGTWPPPSAARSTRGHTPEVDSQPATASFHCVNSVARALVNRASAVALRVALVDRVLGEAERHGVNVLDDVDVVRVVDAHQAYFDAIGAVGPSADHDSN